MYERFLKAGYSYKTLPESSFREHYSNLEAVTDVLSPSSPAAIIANDSIVVTGNELLNTFDRLEVAEFSAESLVLGSSLGNLVPIGDEEIEELRDKFLS